MVEQRSEGDQRPRPTKQIAGLREQLQQAEDNGENTADALAAQIAELQSIVPVRRPDDDRSRRGPTRPTSPFSPRPVLTIIAGIFAGLVLGVGGAFAMNALDPRLRREEQLRELYSLPILARVPKEKRAPRPSRSASGASASARASASAARCRPASCRRRRSSPTARCARCSPPQRRDDGNSRSVLVTGPSPSEGKTTTAINLASSLALAGNRVILIEADFRRPTVGEALGVRARVGIGDVLLGNVSLEDALVLAPPFGDNLCALLVDRADDWLAEVLSLPAAEALLEDAKRLADYVVLDSPPLTQVIDAMPLARQVDDVVLVVRLGSSNLTQLAHLGDLLDQNDIKPAGFVVVGGPAPEESSYYREAQRRRNAQSDWLVSFDQETTRPRSESTELGVLGRPLSRAPVTARAELFPNRILVGGAARARRC